MNHKVEKGDILALKGGKTVEVLSVKPDYEREDSILRFDYIDRSELSPMRRTAYPSEIINILRKNQRPSPDPKSVRSYDNPVAKPTKVIIVDGKEYIEKDNNAGSVSPSSVLTPGAGTQVHSAVAAPAKPVISRIKKAPGKSQQVV